jgi:dihydroneopterin aldolase
VDDAWTDSIFITGLAVHAYHGVMPHERKVGQSFKLDILLDIDLGEASRSDRLAHTVSYDQVAETATKAFCAQPYRLIEAAAGVAIDALLEKFPRVARVRITVHKPHAPIAATFDDVGITIARSRDS